jgi:LacI family transcriptional regulator
MEPANKKRRRTSDRVTLGDIALHCNISKASVSRVLNDKLNEFPISDAMIERVKKAAQQLGYRPNRLAKAVVSQRTNLIGLSFIHLKQRTLSSDQVTYENQIMGNFTKAILSHPGFKDYDLVIHDRVEDPAVPLREGDFKPDLLDGLIYLTPSESHTEFLEIASSEFPIVLLGYSPDAEKKIPCVDINNRSAARLAVEHLIETGRKKILMLIPERLQHICCMQERLCGYKEALTSHDLPVTDEFIRTVRTLPDSVNSLMSELRCLDEIDGIFCATDDLAALCMRSLQMLGKSIPQDIAVIGFNNIPLADQITPSLSSVQWPIEAQATVAIDLLLQILKKEIPYEPGFHKIETELVIRESTAMR